MDFSDKLKELEGLLQQGKFSIVGKQIVSIRKNHKIPRRFATQFSNLARRGGLPDQSVFILFPFIKNDKGVSLNPTAEELIEYSASLIRIGSVKEAKKYLSQIDSIKYPQAGLFTAFAHFSNWSYGEAIPFLEKYCQSSKLSTYRRLIGQLNLAVSYFHENMLNEGIPFTDNLLKEAIKNNYPFIEGQCYKLLGEAFLETKQFKYAREHFELAEKFLQDEGELGTIFIRKWQTLLDLYENPRDRDYQQINALKEASRQHGTWETVRHLDFHLCILQKNKTLYRYFCAGTPYDSLKNKISLFWKDAPKLGEYFDWRVFGHGKPERTLNLETGEGDGVTDRIKPGQTNHRLLQILCQDFYRPQRLSGIHEALYPDEYYNPNSSPFRVHMAFQRLNKWFKANDLSLWIEQTRRFYRLRDHGRVAIRLPQTSTGIKSKNEVVIKKIRHEWGTENVFSNKELAVLLEVAPRTSSLLLKELQAAEKIQKIGNSSATRFKLKG